MEMKEFKILIEMTWESTNSEIAEREVRARLDKGFLGEDYMLHVEDYQQFFTEDGFLSPG